mgnify:FL=1
MMLRFFWRSPAPSLRWRLLSLVSIAAVLIVGLAAALSYQQARHEVQELMDGQMTRMGRLMLAQVQQDATHLTNLPDLLDAQRGFRTSHSELTLEYQIGKPDGKVLVRSAEIPTDAFAHALGFSTVIYENKPWRNLILETTDGAYRIQLAQSIRKRDKEALEIARKTTLPLVLVFPLLLVAIYLSVRRGLKPLDELADEVLCRSPENLSLLPDKATPSEVQPLVAALNRLIFRVNNSLENERRFTADAAHELRTPLAAVRIQTQVAMLSEDLEKRNHALAQALAGVDRSTRLVEQMLRLARLDPLARLLTHEKLDLAGLVRDVVAGLRDASSATTITLDLDETMPLIDGDAGLLEIALRNLVDNALRYSAPDSSVTVFLRSEATGLVMGVSDNGPGVEAEELPRLVERFYRGASVQAEGSGLGLTIVHRIAELHGARLELANREGGGFQACMRWPGLVANSKNS